MSINTQKIKILRHLTAIDRKSLSTPFQTLNRYNYLNGQFTVLDYGCGKGDDVRILIENKIDAVGWDPVYHPNTKLKKRDIVNLGFVINVIENPTERKEVLNPENAFTFQAKITKTQPIAGATIRSGIVTKHSSTN